MKYKTIATLLGILALALSAWVPVYEAKALDVTVQYKGSGEIDEDHAIWVWIFDQPTIGQTLPIAFKTISKNGETVRFENLAAETVYVGVTYDMAGGFVPNVSPPTSGSPAAVHGDAGEATGVLLAETAQTVRIEFDDSVMIP